MPRSRAQWEARKRAAEANGWRDLYVAKMERGEIPSLVLRRDGSRVEVLGVQDHCEVGVRYLVKDGPSAPWVLAADVTDLRGEMPPTSIILFFNGRYVRV